MHFPPKSPGTACQRPARACLLHPVTVCSTEVCYHGDGSTMALRPGGRVESQAWRFPGCMLAGHPDLGSGTDNTQPGIGGLGRLLSEESDAAGKPGTARGAEAPSGPVPQPGSGSPIRTVAERVVSPLRTARPHLPPPARGTGRHRSGALGGACRTAECPPRAGRALGGMDGAVTRPGFSRSRGQSGVSWTREECP